MKACQMTFVLYVALVTMASHVCADAKTPPTIIDEIMSQDGTRKQMELARSVKLSDDLIDPLVDETLSRLFSNKERPLSYRPTLVSIVVGIWAENGTFRRSLCRHRKTIFTEALTALPSPDDHQNYSIAMMRKQNALAICTYLPDKEIPELEGLFTKLLDQVDLSSNLSGIMLYGKLSENILTRKGWSAGFRDKVRAKLLSGSGLAATSLHLAYQKGLAKTFDDAVCVFQLKNSPKGNSLLWSLLDLIKPDSMSKELTQVLMRERDRASNNAATRFSIALKLYSNDPETNTAVLKELLSQPKIPSWQRKSWERSLTMLKLESIIPSPESGKAAQQKVESPKEISTSATSQKKLSENSYVAKLLAHETNVFEDDLKLLADPIPKDQRKAVIAELIRVYFLPGSANIMASIYSSRWLEQLSSKRPEYATVISQHAPDFRKKIREYIQKNDPDDGRHVRYEKGVARNRLIIALSWCTNLNEQDSQLVKDLLPLSHDYSSVNAIARLASRLKPWPPLLSKAWANHVDKLIEQKTLNNKRLITVFYASAGDMSETTAMLTKWSKDESIPPKIRKTITKALSKLKSRQ